MHTTYQFLVAVLLTIFILFACRYDTKNDSIPGGDLELRDLANRMSEQVIQSDWPEPDPLKVARNNDIPEDRDDLNKMRTVFKMFNGKQNAGITLPGFGGLKLGKDESSLSIYYVETKVVHDEADSIVYGCGYSIHYLFRKVERGISVENIPSVAASAQLNGNKTQVFYSLQTYGIKGNVLVKFFKPTVNKTFDVEGFGIMQASIDGIHQILADTALSKTLKFEPEILKFIKPYELEQI